MRRSTLIPSLALAPAYLLACTLTIGCAPEEDDAVVTDTPPVGGDDHADHEGHDHGDGHPTKGPHGGSLIELGDEEYHGELVHDVENGQVLIYVLDGAAKEEVMVDAPEATVNLSHDGERKTFTLAASPPEGGDDGSASLFVSTDPVLGEELDHGHDDAKLMIKIDGRAYSGTIRHSEASHDEDHSDHDHE
ncbi:hypothetical protein [Alienimonas chondri]|uniref:Copper chaperone PCu(A)C n=1 Tax=Alienimonas chondri TaxID=2681879 RepID=A0ABX1VAR0_9PLAN|nr:hypothetical protein [Alienimonas chondri]NNJ24858.1 hypothetical protein [Alienimonas chondri]